MANVEKISIKDGKATVATGKAVSGESIIAPSHWEKLKGNGTEKDLLKTLSATDNRKKAKA